VTRIRPETDADIPAIRAVNIIAFGGEAEANLVDSLRADGDLVLSLVAEIDARVVGHVAFSRLFIDTPDGHVAAVSLAPLAVHPDFRHRGIASDLVKAAHSLLRQRGETLAIVIGHPAFYPRFGYSRARAQGFESGYQSDAFMALAFADAPRTGAVRYPAAFSGL
jgi:putative acetyltransferase